MYMKLSYSTLYYVFHIKLNSTILHHIVSAYSMRAMPSLILGSLREAFRDAVTAVPVDIFRNGTDDLARESGEVSLENGPLN